MNNSNYIEWPGAKERDIERAKLQARLNNPVPVTSGRLIANAIDNMMKPIADRAKTK